MVVETFRPGSARALTGADPLLLPTATLFDGTENLRILSANSKAGVILTIGARIRRPDGSILPLVFSHTPNTDRSVKTENYPIGAGALLNLVIAASSGTPSRGETFVQASIIRGLTGATAKMGTLAQAYVTANQPVAWPGTPLESSLSGPGVVRALSVAGGVALATQVFTVPTGARWRPVTVQGSTVTDATVANRSIILQISTGGAVAVARVETTVAIPASTGAKYTWGMGLPNGIGATAAFNTAGLPAGLLLSAGYTITLLFNNVKVGDQIGQADLIVDEYLAVD